MDSATTRHVCHQSWIYFLCVILRLQLLQSAYHTLTSLYLLITFQPQLQVQHQPWSRLYPPMGVASSPLPSQTTFDRRSSRRSISWQLPRHGHPRAASIPRSLAITPRTTSQPHPTLTGVASGPSSFPHPVLIARRDRRRKSTYLRSRTWPPRQSCSPHLPLKSMAVPSAWSPPTLPRRCLPALQWELRSNHPLRR